MPPVGPFLLSVIIVIKCYSIPFILVCVFVTTEVNEQEGRKNQGGGGGDGGGGVWDSAVY